MAPIVVVATTLPFWSVARRPLVIEVRYVLPVLVKRVVDAWVKKVEEAISESGEPVSQRPVDVACTFVPL